jgi:flagellar L-ring protein precursor FlgH
MNLSRELNVAALLMVLCSSVLADGLYNEDRFRSFVSDPKAIRVGDNLTVIVTEIASVTTTARTTADKEGSVSVGLRGNTVSNTASANLADDFNGGGRIERSGKLVAQVTVVVQEIKPNGDLVVKGEQEIEVNDEKQKLVLVGSVRREDIRSDNTVPSNRLSEAKIAYTGEGLLAEKQKPGILTRFLSWLRIL